MGKNLMKRKSYSLIIFLVLCATFSFAQTKVLTTDGKTINSSSFQINDDNITTNYNGEMQTILKNNVLAVIPEGKTPYTFRLKNGKKMNVKKKFFHNAYTGPDKPRFFAYKYLGSPANVGQLYVLNSDGSMTEEQFTSVFKQQQKKLKTNNIVSISAASVALLVGIASLSMTANGLE